jgi:lipopolysaccharide/colanic/teichoic acid biosynthesis glycosyltransferase
MDARIVFLSRHGSSVTPPALPNIAEVVIRSVAAYEPSEIASLARRLGVTAVAIGEVLHPEHVQRLRAALAADKMRLLLAPPDLLAWDYMFRVRQFGDRTLLETRPLTVCTPAAEFTKRLLDVSIAIVAIVISAPLMLAASLAILVADGPPVHFFQQRIGKNGKPFSIIKLRTMRRDADASYAGGIHTDSRVTRVGSFLRRTSIDELPQFFNVLSGEMSVVGPRPEMVSYAERYTNMLPRYQERHRVRPGITCWGALYMKRILSEADATDVLAHDLFYIQHWSILLDLTIVLKTAAEVLFHRHE